MSDTWSVATWADGFGFWHAKVSVPYNAELPDAAVHNVARDAILAELEVRVTNLDHGRMLAVLAELHHDAEAGTLVAEYREEWPDLVGD
ncbi:hypothetical protein OG563_26600 [Nocardia vinacea]|uniref:DUF1902 domain-containing protein n=1 Tax=Nocardia vinacea TaxID=96468 RepID=A0ABZ1YLF7_9NOCA|nr:hypothetical protein [Nocardia vinacea]